MKLEHYVEINTAEYITGQPEYTTRFVVGNQSFDIGAHPLATRVEAEWYRDQFITALKVMVGEVTDT